MQTIQHATNLPYIPQYTMWNYAMEHPVLFFMMVCFVAYVFTHMFDNFLKLILLSIAKVYDNKNNKIEESEVE